MGDGRCFGIFFVLFNPLFIGESVDSYNSVFVLEAVFCQLDSGFVNEQGILYKGYALIGCVPLVAGNGVGAL